METLPEHNWDWVMPNIRVGQRIDGYCGGVFGRDSYHCRRVEAIGFDWIVLRNDKEEAEFLFRSDIDLALQGHDPKFKDLA